MANHVLNGVVRRVRTVLALREAEELDDAGLLRGFAAGNADCFAAIVRRHGPMVLGVCRRLLPNPADTEDAFQAAFIVLVRKARSLRHPERLAGWLYQVAYRVARKARRRVVDRRDKERALVDAVAEAPVPDLVWRELRPVLDEELNRLPENLRLPVVLCFLQGLTKREAARRLSWPEGTVSSRLQHARERLRVRLSARGLALSAGVLHLALFHGTAPAAVPAALIVSTTNTATAAALATTATAAAALAEGVVQSMFHAKLKFVAAGVLTLGLLGGGAGWVLSDKGTHGAAYAEGPAPAPAAAAKPEAPAADDRPYDALVEEMLARVSEHEAEVMTKTAVLKRLLYRSPEDDQDGEVAKAQADLRAAEAALKAARAKAALVEDDKRKADAERLRRALYAAQIQLAEMQLQIAEARAREKELAAKVKKLEADIEQYRERVAWSERMAQKGYITKAQVQADRSQLQALMDDLNRLRSRQELARHKAELASREWHFDRLTKEAERGTSSPADLDKARIELAHARIELARLNIREEWRAIVEARGREVERTQKAVEQKLLPASELEKARKALDEARRRLAEVEK